MQLKAEAKGRVERANGTLQNRLVKEMRLANICSLEAANAFLPRFIEEYNHKFSVTAESDIEAHRPVGHTPGELEIIFAQQSTHKVYKNLTLRFENTIYQITSHHHVSSLRGAWVTVCKNKNREVTLLHRGEELAYIPWKRDEAWECVLDSKALNTHIDTVKQKQKRQTGWKPAADHPWRQYAT